MLASSAAPPYRADGDRPSWPVVLPREEGAMAGPQGVTRRRRSSVTVLVAVAAALALVSVSCSKNRDTTSTTSAAPKLISIYVQKFRYHGVPATIPHGYTQ